MVKIILYILFGLLLLYINSLSEKRKKQARPVVKPGDGRKDDEFSLEDLMRRLQPQQMEPPKPAETVPQTVTYRKLERTEHKLPFEKRQPLERTDRTEAKSREITPQTVVYDDAAIANAKAHEHGAHRLLPDSERAEYGDGDASVRDWFDVRQAIISQEILRRPEY